MRSIKHNKGLSAAVAAMVAGVILLGFALVNLLGSDSNGSTDSRAEAGLGKPFSSVPDDPSIKVGPADKEEFAQAFGKTPGGGITFPGAGINGLTGEGGSLSTTPHRIQLRVSSNAALTYVGYVVPTSLDNSYGVVKNAGSSWSLTTTGYGPPDYAQLFAQAGPRGVAVTCTITIDGRVTESRTTEGPYGQLFCQG